MTQQTHANEGSTNEELTAHSLFHLVLPTPESELEMEVTVLMKNIQELPKTQYDLFYRIYNLKANTRH